MPYIETCIWILIGLISGSFVNVCIDRLPLQFADKKLRSRLLKSSEYSFLLKNHLRYSTLSLWNPTRSFCFYCGHQLQWFENIPMLSYILIKGHCRVCKTRLVPRLFWTETMHCFCYGIFGWFFQNWIWSLFASINFSFLWILAYCRSHQQMRIKLFFYGGVLLVVNFCVYFFIRKSRK